MCLSPFVDRVDVDAQIRRRGGRLVFLGWRLRRPGERGGTSCGASFVWCSRLRSVDVSDANRAGIGVPGFVPSRSFPIWESCCPEPSDDLEALVLALRRARLQAAALRSPPFAWLGAPVPP